MNKPNDAKRSFWVYCTNHQKTYNISTAKLVSAHWCWEPGRWSTIVEVSGYKWSPWNKTVRWTKFLHWHSGKTKDHFLSWTPVQLCSTASWDFNCQSSPLFPCRIRGTASSSVQLTVLGVGILKDRRGLAQASDMMRSTYYSTINNAKLTYKLTIIHDDFITKNGDLIRHYAFITTHNDLSIKQHGDLTNTICGGDLTNKHGDLIGYIELHTLYFSGFTYFFQTCGRFLGLPKLTFLWCAKSPMGGRMESMESKWLGAHEADDLC